MNFTSLITKGLSQYLQAIILNPKHEKGNQAVEVFQKWDRRYLLVSLIQDQEVGVCGEAVKYGPRHRRKQDQEMCHLHMAAAKIRNETTIRNDSRR